MLGKLFGKVAGDGVGGLVEKIGNVADKFIRTPEEKEAFIKEMLALENQERANARQREVELAKSGYGTWLGKNVTPLIALFTIGATFILIGVLIFYEVTSSQRDLVIYMLGIMSSAVVSVLGYYFGSSDSSAKKNNILADFGKNQK